MTEEEPEVPKGVIEGIEQAYNKNFATKEDMKEVLKKPCGEYHPLPCGLDVDCPMPAEYLDLDKTNEENWKRYVEDNNE